LLFDYGETGDFVKWVGVIFVVVVIGSVLERRDTSKTNLILNTPSLIPLNRVGYMYQITP